MKRKNSDEREKELALVTDYLIKNEPGNLGKTEYFELQENMLINDYVELSHSFTVDHIYHVAENRYVSLSDLMLLIGIMKNWKY